MQPIRQVIDDAPATISIPAALRHKRVELIIWPLDDATEQLASPKAELAAPPLKFRTMQVQQVIMPSREDRYER
jgi:hypothetical protein